MTHIEGKKIVTIEDLRLLLAPQALHDSEINFSLSCFWDNQWTVKIGDEMNGFKAEGNCFSFSESLAWLDTTARRLYPNSGYAKLPALAQVV